jgi:hypothetical protein
LILAELDCCGAGLATDEQDEDEHPSHFFLFTGGHIPVVSTPVCLSTRH